MHPQAPLPAPAPGRWHPSPAIRLSLWLHGALLGALLLFPRSWAWLLSIFLADQLLLTLSGLWPKSSLLGPNLVRLPLPAPGLVVLTFDDGPDPEITPGILDLLDAHGAKASFFCIGKRAERYPDLLREILCRGHSVENHSFAHSPLFAFSPLGAFRREIGKAQSVLSGIGGRPPRFFRAPMGFRNPLLDPALAPLGLRYVSWTRRGFDTTCRKPETVLRRLTRNLAAGDILLLHDGGSARSSEGEPVSVRVLSALLPILAARHLRAVSLPMAMGMAPGGAEALSSHDSRSQTGLRGA
ncbi:Peptidoglycan-N-acetylglucosamine deacetylase [Methylacidimicrobium cyclopophantes]|uniref:Peptidoglycan-N-acetylglucosamine deacetylase n=1 Tax=Methylacidimicrobium cyclopophantes TaxID=1041766 RepID=A0A5E6M5H8_9BACT|nr:polysaccharide deacetylase family protein [Methylacidimicrobium cyclopophantes]VVM04823.1 Peptidoglycan-N-acetylglucosamine deacetylase [Methylacidimicrobium cyclopophantes]